MAEKLIRTTFKTQSQDISSTTETDPILLVREDPQNERPVWYMANHLELELNRANFCHSFHINKHSRKQWRNGLSSSSVMNKAKGT
jgi:hypothetical protein